jgi:UrcA family protein
MTRLATKMLLLGGLAGLAAAGAAGAAGASPESVDAPSLIVHYSAGMLATDSGARAVYHRIALAAEQVCPNVSSSTRFTRPVVIECRQQAIADAVDKIHNQRLAAVHAAASSKSG